MSDKPHAFYVDTDCFERCSDPPSRAPDVILHLDLPRVRMYGHPRSAPVGPSVEASVLINGLRRKNENLDALVTKLQTELEVARAERDTWKKACDGLRECMLGLIKP